MTDAESLDDDQSVDDTMLEPLGLSPEALQIYRVMLQHPELEVEQLRRHVQVNGHAFDQALGSLRDLHLVIPRWTGDVLHGVEYAVHPTYALPLLAQRRKAEATELISRIERAETDARLFAESFGYSLVGEQQAYVEIVKGSQRANLRMQQFVSARSVLGFNDSVFPTGAGPADESPDKPLLDRGVEMRIIFRQAYMGEKSAREHARWMAKNGGEVRFAPNLPMRMMIFDRQFVVIPLNADDHDAGALVYRGDSVARLAVFFFEYFWDKAISHPDVETKRDHGDEGELSGQEREFLRLLGRGATDAQVARDLGISLRTVRRIASSLCQRTGASGRFELGVRAAQKGWVR